MVNFGLNPASLLGIALAVAGAGLYFLRSIRPELSRDHDIFFAAVGLLCGLILLSQGWRLDPILQFGQFLLAGSTIFFAFESIRLRGVATEQAKRNTPIVDDDRPVSKVYRYDAELYDELNPVDEEPQPRPRIVGSRDSRSRRVDDYEEMSRPSTSPRNNSNRRSSSSSSSTSSERSERTGPSDRPRKRRPRIVEEEIENRREEIDSSSRPSRSSSASTSRPSNRDANSTTARPRRNRPTGQESTRSPRQNFETASTDYADYQPIDYPDDNEDNSSNFD